MTHCNTRVRHTVTHACVWPVFFANFGQKSPQMELGPNVGFGYFGQKTPHIVLPPQRRLCLLWAVSGSCGNFRAILSHSESRSSKRGKNYWLGQRQQSRSWMGRKPQLRGFRCIRGHSSVVLESVGSPLIRASAPTSVWLTLGSRRIFLPVLSRCETLPGLVMAPHSDTRSSKSDKNYCLLGIYSIS